MSSSRRRRLSPPPPQLPDDAIRDILLRTPPDDPRRLFRASLCCKPWRRLLSDPAFCRTYRELHRRTPPLLGFIHNKGSAEKPHHCVLVPTTPFRPPGGTHRPNWIVLDSRHGRVLLYSFPPKPDIEFVVWDPITDEQWRMLLPDFQYGSWSATVLCAMDGCDHLDCHGGPFLVAFAGLNKLAFASVYSSVAGEWSDTIFAEYPDTAMEQYPGMEYMRFMDSGLGFSVLMGKTVYFPSNMSNRILEYNIAEKRLSVIDTRFQEYQQHIVLVMAEDDGVLVFAGVKESSLHLWSREVGEDGAVAWPRHSVIHLDMLVPRPGCWTTPDWDGISGGLLVGSADGVIFLSTHVGSYMVDISSGKARKLTNMRFTDKIIPYVSFYTIDHARGIKHHCHEHLGPST
uniref:Uncharacterized protein n=1 Tax=Avena sativa TaxID=4498 RepID=A0ACD6ADP9_AVESA